MERERDRERPFAAGAPPSRRIEGGYGCGAWWWTLALLVALLITGWVVRAWWWRAGVQPTEPVQPTLPS